MKDLELLVGKKQRVHLSAALGLRKQMRNKHTRPCLGSAGTGRDDPALWLPAASRHTLLADQHRNSGASGP